MTVTPTREVLRGWGGVHQGRSWVYRPRSAEEAAVALDDAAARGLTVAHRGAGLSYGDLAVNEGGAVMSAGVRLSPKSRRLFTISARV